MKTRIIKKLWMLVASAVLPFATLGSRGATHSLEWPTLDGGGNCAGAKFRLSGVVGQPSAGNSTGGTYVQQGGFVPAFIKTVGPALKVTPAGDALILTWPANSCSGFHIEGSASVMGGPWTDLGQGFVSGTDRLVAVSLSSGHAFFRLRKDCPASCSNHCPQ